MKRLAIQGHDAEREHMFFRREVRSARYATDWPLHLGILILKPSAWASMGRFWLGRLYQTFSKFGTSFWRPLFFWLIAVIVAATFYLGENQNVAVYHESLRVEGIRAIPAHVVSAAKIWAEREKWRCVEYYVSKSDERTSAQYSGLSKKVRETTNAPAEAMRLAFRNALIVLGNGSDAALRSYGCLYGLELYGGSTPIPVMPQAVFITSAIQKTASLLFIFLFGLAIRNRLKIK
jgi:hypothetical protein